jgi:hypothetical protein
MQGDLRQNVTPRRPPPPNRPRTDPPPGYGYPHSWQRPPYRHGQSDPTSYHSYPGEQYRHGAQAYNPMPQGGPPYGPTVFDDPNATYNDHGDGTSSYYPADRGPQSHGAQEYLSPYPQQGWPPTYGDPSSPHHRRSRSAQSTFNRDPSRSPNMRSSANHVGSLSDDDRPPETSPPVEQMERLSFDDVYGDPSPTPPNASMNDEGDRSSEREESEEPEEMPRSRNRMNHSPSPPSASSSSHRHPPRNNARSPQYPTSSPSSPGYSAFGQPSGGMVSSFPSGCNRFRGSRAADVPAGRRVFQAAAQEFNFFPRKPEDKQKPDEHSIGVER